MAMLLLWLATLLDGTRVVLALVLAVVGKKNWACLANNNNNNSYDDYHASSDCGCHSRIVLTVM
jgi:hypothetical protein